MNSSKTFQQVKSFAASRNLPLIPIKETNLNIVSEPSEFYKLLLDGINSSSRRINLSALYLGIGPRVKGLLNAIDEQVQKNSSLHVNINVDAKRATRSEHGLSSLTMMSQLLESCKRVNLNLIDTAGKSILNRFMSNFQRWNEIMSTYHIKMMVFDNDVILTGANLSDVYFDRRRDRYMILKQENQLADYMSDLLNCINTARANIRSNIQALNDRYRTSISEEDSDDQSDTVMIPLIQFGLLGIEDKEDFVTYFESVRSSECQAFMSSGYFNPSEKINSIKLDSVLASSEKANNFTGGIGLAKYVPRLYTALYEKYVSLHQKCRFHIFNKDGWSFHAKGLWYDCNDGIYMNIIGSSNFNCRSSKRDFEAQMLIITCNKNLISKLQQEQKNLWQGSVPLNRDHLSNLGPISRFLARLFKSFL